MNQANKRYVIPVLMVALLAGMMILAGCSDDDDPVRVIPEPVLGPGSSNELMDLFLANYEAMDVEQYVALLDPGFLMILQEQTTQEFPSVGATLDFAEEERSHIRMFSGELLEDPDGDFVPGLSAISFSYLRALDTWSPSDDEDRFPGTEWAPFEVGLLFERGQSFSTLKVNGTVKIYTRAHEIEIAGTSKTYYLMAGMVDFTNLGKSVESTTWGGVKAIFR